ncbi:hypothetical protein BDU57DRAFT_519318 [Ampelomyces quisqualis]|uniref:SP-RING-type domain-containing protein n=1 Tax=Ampelomyces quisqualis TaxID=50730 RepID=A0A6A5QHR5_AMPQU|nr:hypothetical protein BDU57DRAFT_519318 [Ampelomyces quisqualis]
MAGTTPADAAMSQTLNFALGNLGGRQKSWMHPNNPNPPSAPSDLPQKPPHDPVRRRGRPPKTPNPPSAPSDLTQQPSHDPVRRRGRPPKNPNPPADLKQKPPHVPVRRRGRPPKNPAAQLQTVPPHTAEPAHPPVEPPLERHPPSNSTSPQLANVVTDPHQSGCHPSDITVFPSPTPSEEIIRSAPLPDVRGADGTPSIDFMRFERLERADHVSGTASGRSSANSVMREGYGPKRPSGEAGAQLEKRHRVGQSLQEQLSGAMTRRPSASSRESAMTASRRTSMQQTHLQKPNFDQVQSYTPLLQQQTPRSAQRAPPFEDPSNGLQHDSSCQAVAHPRDANTNFDPDGTPYNIQPAWYTVQECWSVLRQFQATHHSALRQPQDKARFDVLKKATDAEDWAYLFMHQIYCMSTCNPSALPPDISFASSFRQALQVIQNVIDSNTNLSPTVVNFFATYPYDFSEIMAKFPVALERRIRMFVSFISLSPNYTPLRASCQRRRFPPLPWEMVHYLGIDSPTFRRLLYISILRNIWQGSPQTARHAHYESHMVDLYQESEAEYHRRITFRAIEGRFDPIQTSQDNENHIRHWGVRWKKIVEEFEASLRQQGYAVTTSSAAMLPQVEQQFNNAQWLLRGPAASNTSRVHPSAISHFAQPNTRQPGIQHRMLEVSNPPVLPAQPPTQQTMADVPLLPVPGFNLAQQRQPNPSRYSLHQAHLRSPILRARGMSSPLYHFVQSYFMQPTRLSNANRSVDKWTFTFTADMMQSIAPLILGHPYDVGERQVNASSKTFRLRCIKWPAQGCPDGHVWSCTDTSWIPYSYFVFNGVTLEQRRKVHHGKDLPIDITHLIKKGDNVLEVSVIADSADTTFLEYLVAIESLGFVSHDDIKSHCTGPGLISGKAVLADILKKLSGGNEDDDIAVVESKLTINLFDPFSSSKMCDIPVRGRACLHNDCFDLETFLSTRRRKGDVSTVDIWRCPICNGDARPHHLVTDGFLQDVKERLDAQGLSETRAIIVHQDGNWYPKTEVRDPNGVSDDPPTPTLHRPSLVPEVIDLSD